MTKISKIKSPSLNQTSKKKKINYHRDVLHNNKFNEKTE
jgi:hypothetical protein